MTYTPMAHADSLRVGSVEFVSPDKIEVLLDIEAPDTVALNAGSPRAFPRVNGYVLVPSDGAFAVGQVEWITVERSQYPKRKGMQDFGLIDVPYPLRKMSLNPVGQLSLLATQSDGEVNYTFIRGIQAFPTVGDPVLLPTTEQLRSIVESGANRRVLIGTSPLAADAEVKIDPDRLFGRHLAILGNTGSGKSCSVAGLIRWSLESARQRFREQGHSEKTPNARFIILDPNGEYGKAFLDLGAQVYAVEASEEAGQLRVPLWLWNSDEWSAITQASPRTQRPTLVHSLRAVRDGSFDPSSSRRDDMRRFLRTVVSVIQMEYRSGSPWGAFPKPKGFCERLRKLVVDFEPDADFSDKENAALQSLHNHANQLIGARSGNHPTWEFSKSEVKQLLEFASVAHAAFGGTLAEALPLDADVPRKFNSEQFLRSVEANAEVLNVAEHVEPMLMRIRTLLADSRLRTVCGDDGELSLLGWLSSLFGEDPGAANITVIDLSLVPADAVHILTAVIGRMALEALQRYRKVNDGDTLPTVLVMEEAHTFIKRYASDSESRSTQEICSHTFERIAREGRKFGLGLVLSSQRPSELSPTVLSQCNTFLLHRLSNHTDQDLVQRLVPDNLRSLLRDLPSLPSKNAILLGWASELPITVEMLDLPADHRPRSDDPDYWYVWTGSDAHGNTVNRPTNWDAVARDWQQIAEEESSPSGYSNSGDDA
ncbi:ATP-binding protein [Hoyosella sp. YIM 151337]|uniref:ATP-binding protein n=1 Tax=Hoyosella sp. YIM 151337 TaxID=2992742 RepID=UPI0022358BED|nr:ATP-binding protein [Hoyosella sp. YIM 151337]MCW4354166.1 ATP-binding protein [Hoyosella sp. YIM 151337]